MCEVCLWTRMYVRFYSLQMKKLTCTYVHMHVQYVHMSCMVRKYVCMYVCMYICTYIICVSCMYVYMYVCIYMYVCTYVYNNVCHVCMYVCTVSMENCWVSWLIFLWMTVTLPLYIHTV